jgi:N-acetylgalactosamine-N,N'-diacetylbacillosaminyl-diphospho-undecaprenol 4-alpha-N-acetylgalactosaminyltransferase
MPIAIAGHTARTASARPSILFIINSLGGGGAERVVSRLLNLSHCYREHYRISLALLDKVEIAYPIPDFVTVHQLECEGSLYRSIWQLKRLVGRLKPDLRLSFLTRANIANCFASGASAAPWLISERINTSAHLGSGPRGALAKLFVRHTYPRARSAIAVSEGVGEDLIRSFNVSPDRIEVISNPVDLADIRAQAAKADPLGTAEPFIFAMGRLNKSKNHAMLMRGFARAAVPGRLVIAGDGPERESLLGLAQELGIADRVSLPGFIANPYAVMRRARIFALTSNVEGFPNALVEAMALGIPAVATNCPDGPAEILARKRIGEVSGLVIAPAGILVPVNDHILLAQALELLFDGPAREQVVAGANTRVRDYSPRKAVDSYWRIIARELAK